MPPIVGYAVEVTDRILELSGLDAGRDLVLLRLFSLEASTGCVFEYDVDSSDLELKGLLVLYPCLSAVLGRLPTGLDTSRRAVLAVDGRLICPGRSFDDNPGVELLVDGLSDPGLLVRKRGVRDL